MKLSKEIHQQIKTETVEYLRGVNTFYVQDILNKYPPADVGEERDVRLLVWEAMQEIRQTDGIVFVKMRGHFAGHYHRADHVQIEAHAHRQRAAGTRKQRRAAEKLRIAAAMAPNAADKARMSDAADRIAVREAMRRTKRPIQ